MSSRTPSDDREPDRLRFHLDESVPSPVAEGLRRRSIEVTTSYEAELLGSNDEDQLAYARSVGAVLVTQDSDFLRLAASGAAHCGIAYYLPGSRTIGELVRGLVRLHATVSPHEMTGRVEFV